MVCLPLKSKSILTQRPAMFAVAATVLTLLLCSSARMNAQCAGEGGNSLGFDMAPETSQGVVENAVKQIPTPMAPGPVKPTWNSLKENYQVPSWFRGAKFGIFMHFGIFSVPAHGNEWYEKSLYAGGDDSVLKVLGGNDMALGANAGPNSTRAWHTEHFGPPDQFGYKDFIPMFKAERFDARAWARLFREAGAKYVVPVAEHHDGFPMYDSRLTDWCAGKMGPKRDLFGELATAVRAEGLHLGASSHRAEHDWFFDGGRQFDSDVNDPRYAAFYGPAHLRLVKPGYEDKVYEDWTFVSPEFLDDWLARAAEIVEKYHPDLVYFDWWINQPSFRKSLAEFAAFYYNQGAQRGTGAVIN